MASMGEIPALGMPLKQDHAPQHGDARQRMGAVTASGVFQVPSKIFFTIFWS